MYSIYSVQKNKYKKKLRAANSQLAESRHNTSLKVFELKDDIARLTEENVKLLGMVKYSLNKHVIYQPQFRNGYLKLKLN